jgi:hypothetical protein
MKMWTGQSISEVGSQVSQLAIPWLAAVGLHATPLEFSLLGVPTPAQAELEGGLVEGGPLPAPSSADA